MAICKDCIHFDVCRDATIPNLEYKGPVADKSKECRHFKNKADFEEVKHGEWIDDIQKITTVAGVDFNGIVGYKCSLCGRREGSKEPYCNCGAKMDGVKEE